MSTQKAVKAQIELGSITLDVYQLPNSQYFLSLTQVAESIEMSLKRMSQLRELELSLTIYPQGFRMSESIKVEGGTKPVQIISLDDTVKYWTLAASRQNMKAFLLVSACAAETLERRADAAFGIDRSEEERQQRLKIRQDGIQARRSFTDAIQDWMADREVSDNYRRFIYSNVSDCLNRSVLGMTARSAKNTLKVTESSALRNAIPKTALNEIKNAEELTMRLIDKEQMEPLEAMKEACRRLMTREIGIE